MKRTFIALVLTLTASFGTNANIATTQQKTNELAQVAYRGATVYITPKGECYHYRDCRTLSRSRTVIAVTLGHAQDEGRRACNVCH